MFIIEKYAVDCQFPIGTDSCAKGEKLSVFPEHLFCKVDAIVC